MWQVLTLLKEVSLGNRTRSIAVSYGGRRCTSVVGRSSYARPADIVSLRGCFREIGARMQLHSRVSSNAPQSDGNLTDRQLFGSLWFDRISALDADAYENPDVIFDLNRQAVPDELLHRFELAFDGGTLEHVFDIAAALRNICRMVKTGGRIVHISPMSNCVDHGFYSFSPTLFADFYLANQWLVHRLAIARFVRDPSSEPWEIRDHRDFDFTQLGALSPGTYFLLACVQSTTDSTCDAVPNSRTTRNSG